MMRGASVAWWWIGAPMMVFCMVMMAWMMAGHSRHGRHGRNEDPERTLADRLARGEIDLEEYNRLLEALHGTNPSTPVAPAAAPIDLTDTDYAASQGPVKTGD